MHDLSVLFVFALFCGAVFALWWSLRPRKPTGGTGSGGGRGNRPPIKEV
jgi:hypothetical protein